MSTTELFPQEADLLFPTLLIVFLPLIFLVTKRLKASFSKSPTLPPGPFPWPILGNIPHLKNEPLYVTLARFAKTYGSDLISIKLGSQLLIVGSSPAAAMEELFSGGTDSSSSTVEWLMAELIRNPKCMKIIREELEREIGSQEMVMECDLPKLKYLECCLKEPLRLPPPAPLPIPHRDAETCQVMNYTVPKNSEILVNVWAIGRDTNHWEDPLEFKPERFLNSSLDFKGANAIRSRKENLPWPTLGFQASSSNRCFSGPFI
ncbi:Cytochrome P450 76C4 [Morus notabilis]|uniref:Cytochrome P450 76C4 n=1 Tax=Morus notabilis TaxID=981085 RepID=W9SJ10_9ROSA|nr:Cytochrome P450 76C4 [Morus notabilis]